MLVEVAFVMGLTDHIGFQFLSSCDTFAEVLLKRIENSEENQPLEKSFVKSID